MSNVFSLKPLSAPEILLRLSIVLPGSLRLMALSFESIRPIAGAPRTDIVSYASIHHLDTRFNYGVFLLYGAMTLAIMLISMYGVRRDVLVPLIQRCWRPRNETASTKDRLGWRLQVHYYLGDSILPWLERQKARLMSLAGMPPIWGALLLGIMIVWVLNVEYVPLGGVIRDSFHEGEYLGLAPAILQSHQAFTSVFFIHGWGMDALPELLARAWGWRDNGIAGVRFLRMLESALAWLGCAWVLYEIMRTTQARVRLSGFCALLLLFFLLRNDFYVMTLRRTIALFQLAGILYFFRCNQRQPVSQPKNLALAFGMGASIPLGFLYNYSEAASLTVVYATSCLLAPLFGRRAAAIWWIGGASGGVLAITLVASWLGLEQVAAMSRQILYWARYGQAIWFTPIELSKLTTSFFWVMVLAQGLAIVHLLIAWTHASSLKDWLNHDWLVILLGVAALMSNHIGLDRAMEHHLGWASLSSALLLLALGMIWLDQLMHTQSADALETKAGRLAAIVALGLLMVVTGFKAFAQNVSMLDPLLAVTHVMAAYHQFATPDEETLPSRYQHALSELRPEVARSRSFYTLTSEGIWYYLFDKPASSAFHHVIYARSPQAQADVIRALRSNMPDILLVSSKTTFDLAPNDATPLIYRFALEHYRPFRDIGGCWFWKRSPHVLQVPQDALENSLIGGFSGIKEDHGEPAYWLAGWIKLPSQAVNNESLRLYASMADSKELVGMGQIPLGVGHKAGETVYWKIDLPISMRDETNSLRIWWYDPQADRLCPVAS